MGIGKWISRSRFWFDCLMQMGMTWGKNQVLFYHVDMSLCIAVGCWCFKFRLPVSWCDQRWHEEDLKLYLSSDLLGDGGAKDNTDLFGTTGGMTLKHVETAAPFWEIQTLFLTWSYCDDFKDSNILPFIKEGISGTDSIKPINFHIF